MKCSLLIVLAAVGSLVSMDARAQTDVPSPTAEPGRLEAPQPQTPPAGAGAPAAGQGSAASSGVTDALPAPAPADSPTAATLLSDWSLKDGGPLFGLPLVRETLWPRGLPGWFDLSAGFSIGKQSRWENIAVNAQLELAPGLRAHFTGAYRDRHDEIRADLSWQEGYVEGYGFTPFMAGKLGWNVRIGRTANLAWPYPDPLTLFDYVPFLEYDQYGDNQPFLVGYEHLTGVVDWEHPSGFGFHGGLNRRFRHAVGGRGDLKIHTIDYYARYRRLFRGGFTGEARLGALNTRERFTDGLNPPWPDLGASLYLGKEWAHGSAGLMVEKIDNQSTRYGFRINVSANKVTSFLGHFLTGYRRESEAVTVQVPLVSIWSGQRPQYNPPLFSERVGQIEATRMYRLDSKVWRDMYPHNYEYILRRTGDTKGSGLTRVVREGPRAFTEFGAMDGSDIDRAPLVARFRQDLTYDLYRVPRLGSAQLAIRLVNKLKPTETVPNATIEAVDQVGRKQLLTAPQGQVVYSAEVPENRPLPAKLQIAAPGFLPETAEVQLKAGDPVPTEILVRPATGLLTGVLIDDETGEPIGEVEVVVTGGGGQPRVLLTDARGQFRLEDLPAGRYAVATHAPRYRDQTVPAEIIAGEQKQVEVRLLSRPASIAGKLLTADGKPVAGATVTLRDDAGNPVGNFTTLADGTFGTTGLKAGTYTLQAKTVDGKTVETTVKLTGGEIATIELRLP